MADEDKKLALAAAAPLLPRHVTLEKTTTKKKTPPIPAVKLVSMWALETATVLLAYFAFVLALAHYDIHLPSWMLPRAGRLTVTADTAAAEMGALNNHWMMWSSAAQAAAVAAAVAAAALLLPGRWTSGGRRALAYVAFAAAAATHLMLGRIFARFLTGDLENINAWTVLVYMDMFFLVKGDIRCLKALLGRGDYAN